MRTHAKRIFISFTFLFLFLMSAEPTLAAWLLLYAEDANGKIFYAGCHYTPSGDPEDPKGSVHNISEEDCTKLAAGGNAAITLDTRKPLGRLDIVSFSVEPRLVEHVREVLKDNNIESMDVERALSEWDVFDKITVPQSEKAIEVIKKAKIKDAWSCRSEFTGRGSPQSLIKIPDTDKNRATLKQARVPHMIFRRSEVAGQILALGPLSVIRSALDKERITMKEKP